MELHPAIKFFTCWAVAFGTLGAALVLLAAYYRVLDADLGLRTIGKEFWIAAIASLIQGAGLWLFLSLVPGVRVLLIIPAAAVAVVYKLGHMEDWGLYEGFGLFLSQVFIVSALRSLIAGQFGMVAITLTIFGVCVAFIAGIVKGVFGGDDSSSSDTESEKPSVESKISWLRMGLLRLALGLGGVAAGLALGALFVTVWHWAAVIVLFLFGVHVHGWIYAWDLVFVAALLREGYRYTARMPPPNPFTKGETLLAATVIGTPMFTPAQAAYGISELLLVAPRFFFWGIRHLRRVEWPPAGMARTAEQIYGALQSAGTWVPYDQLRDLGRSQEESAHAMAMLVRAELAQARFHEGVASFRTSEPEWV
jgi:hypothetical protein